MEEVVIVLVKEQDDHNLVELMMPKSAFHKFHRKVFTEISNELDEMYGIQDQEDRVLWKKIEPK